MKNSKYIDVSAAMQIIGNIYNNPSLLDNSDRYHFAEDDFPNNFLRICFGTIYNLYQLGAKTINLINIEDYLSQRPKEMAEFKANKGQEFIIECSENANYNAFNFYYNRLKKMTLLRAFEDMGMDLSWLYDPDNIFDTKKKEEQENWLDNSSLSDIYNKINDRIDEVKMEYVEELSDNSCQISEGIDDFIEELKTTPSLGYPLYGRYMNTVTRGARFKKFFLRSAATGVGKTRSMIADACYIGCNQMYDLESEKWISIGAAQPVLYIATEQDLRECQTMCLSFLAAVDEEHILKGEYFSGEWERIVKAKQILKQSKIQFECIPEFDVKMIKTIIQKHIRINKVEYVFFDYIHSSASILMEVGGKSGVKGLREDNVLFLLASALKEIAVQEDIFILSSTQLNSQYLETDTPDQNLLRGSKAIADRIDIGMILMEVTKDDKEKLNNFIRQNNFTMPNVKLSIYKNRQGRYKNMYLWMNADRSTCRFNPIFATDWNYNIIEMEDLIIKVKEEMAF